MYHGYEAWQPHKDRGTELRTIMPLSLWWDDRQRFKLYTRKWVCRGSIILKISKKPSIDYCITNQKFIMNKMCFIAIMIIMNTKNKTSHDVWTLTFALRKYIMKWLSIFLHPHPHIKEENILILFYFLL